MPNNCMGKITPLNAKSAENLKRIYQESIDKKVGFIDVILPIPEEIKGYNVRTIEKIRPKSLELIHEIKQKYTQSRFNKECWEHNELPDVRCWIKDDEDTIKFKVLPSTQEEIEELKLEDSKSDSLLTASYNYYTPETYKAAVEKYGYATGYYWAVENRGCKWDLCDLEIDDDGQLHFWTAWSPFSEEVIEKLIEFGATDFEYDYWESGCDFAGRYSVSDGEADHEEWDYIEGLAVIDPDTLEYELEWYEEENEDGEYDDVIKQIKDYLN